MKNKIRNIAKTDIFKLTILSFALNLLLEVLNRRSLWEGFKYLFTSPYNNIYNILIILLTLSIALFFKRKLFITIVVSSIWIICGIANCIILGFRTTPFTAADLSMIGNAFQIMDKYLTLFQFILIIIGVVLLLIGLIFLFIKLPKSTNKKSYTKTLLSFAIIGALTFSLHFIGVKTHLVSTNFENLGYAFKDYGFSYCFTNSLIDVGIGKPEKYSDYTMELIKDKIDSTPEIVNDVKPNIIMIQLESFFDPHTVKGVKFNKNPVPNFQALKDNYTSGYLTVPSVGAGTANTEFEILTGMSTDYFGAGEYPFKTVLTDEACDSIARTLKDQGYTAFGMHNNDGAFYNRDTVYANLGFDTFIPLEYMYNVEHNEQGWAKDNVLEGNILDCLNSTPNQDFIYAVSVQAHGRYPSGMDISNDDISIYGMEGNQDSMDYYLGQIHEMDEFIGNLVKELENSKEPTVLVLFGDHLPSLGLESEILTNGTMFQTEYVIWDNMGLKQNDQTLEAYQLNTYLFELLGLKNGTLQKFHRTFSKSKNYKTYLEFLEYDMLYGKRYIYNGENPFEMTDMKLGIKPIEITDVIVDNENIYVKGTNFNEFSNIMINGDVKETEYIDINTLRLTKHTLSPRDEVSVIQIGNDHHKFGQTTPYIMQ